MPENLREIVLGILTEIGENGTYSHTAIRAALDRYQYFSKRDRAFITKVCEGTVERMIEIDYIIDCYSTVPVEKMKPVIRKVSRKKKAVSSEGLCERRSPEYHPERGQHSVSGQ